MSLNNQLKHNNEINKSNSIQNSSSIYQESVSPSPTNPRLSAYEMAMKRKNRKLNNSKILS